MNDDKRKRLEEMGGRVTTAEDWLNMTPDEMEEHIDRLSRSPEYSDTLPKGRASSLDSTGDGLSDFLAVMAQATVLLLGAMGIVFVLFAACQIVMMLAAFFSGLF